MILNDGINVRRKTSTYRDTSVQSEVSNISEDYDDGVFHVGAGWYEIAVDGDVVDKVRGKQAAEIRYTVLVQGGTVFTGQEE